MLRRLITLVIAVTLLAPLATMPASSAADTASISGVVTAKASGQPLAGICVVSFSNLDGTEVTTSTDSAGRYRIDGLPPGAYEVHVNHRCTSAVPAYAAWSAPTMELGDGQARNGVSAALDPASALTGVVRAEGTGQPLAGMCVEIWDERTHRQSTVGPTTSDGRWRIDRLSYIVPEPDGSWVPVAGGGLPSGAYAVIFRDCRAVPLYVSEVHDDRPYGLSEPWADPVWVPAGATVNVDAALTLGGAISGTLTLDHTGLPASTCVTLLADGSPVFGAQMTGGSNGPGGYLFGGIAAGDYTIELDPGACGGAGTIPEWWDGATDPDGATVIHLEAGQHVTADAGLAPRPAPPVDCEWAAPAALRFDDVTEGSVHAAAIGCLVHLDLTTGVTPHRYAPGAAVTRGQLATLVWRSLDGQLPMDADPGVPDAFLDDTGSVHEPALDQLAALGVLQGTSAGRASPSTAITRGQAAAVLVRALLAATGQPLLPAADRFSDDTASGHAHSIDQAALAGLVSGRTATTFEPHRLVTRAQAATLVANLLGRAQRDLAPLGSFGPPVG